MIMPLGGYIHKMDLDNKNLKNNFCFRNFQICFELQAPEKFLPKLQNLVFQLVRIMFTTAKQSNIILICTF